MIVLRRSLLLVLTVGFLCLTVPSAWASFTNRAARAAVATLDAGTLDAPAVSTGVRCLLSDTLPVTWAHSSSAWATSQVVEVSTSPTLATTEQSVTFTDNTTTSSTVSGLGSLSALTTYYVRVTTRFASWSATSAIFPTTFSPVC